MENLHFTFKRPMTLNEVITLQSMITNYTVEQLLDTFVRMKSPELKAFFFTALTIKQLN